MAIVISESGALEGYAPDDLIPEAIEQEFAYTAPIAMRQLPGTAPFLGTTITGSFKTTDDRDIPSIAFITAYRDIPQGVIKAIAHYYDGYGIALRPSTNPDMLNVFVVDNALAVPTVVLENVTHTGWGEMSYLAARHVNIEADKTYNFRLDFNSANALTFWIWDESGSMPLEPSLTFGAYTPQSQGDYVGVSCSKTDSYFWDWDDIGVSYHDPRHAVSYYRLVCKDFEQPFAVRAYAYAEGYDPNTSYAQYGIDMYVWNYQASRWDWFDGHTNGPGGFADNIMLEAYDLDTLKYLGVASGASANLAQVLLVSRYPSSFTNSVDSTIGVDYIYAESWNSRGGHVGGMGDIYIKTGSNPSAASFDIYNVDATESISPRNLHIHGEIAWPILWIENIQLLDAQGEPTGIILTPIEHWSFGVKNPSLRFSTRDSCYLNFAGVIGSNVRVNYYTEPAVASAQAILDSDTSRNVTDDYLAKSYAPFELYVEAEYTGAAHPTTIRDVLSRAVNGQVLERIDAHMLEESIQSAPGVANATLTRLSAMRHNLDGSCDMIEASDGVLTIEVRQQFILVPDARHVALARR